MHHRSSLVLGWIALVGRVAAAQVDYFTQSNLQVLAWPSEIQVASKGRAVAGDVTGDLLPDGILLNGGKPVVVYGPAVYRALFSLELEASDLALLPPVQAGQASSLVLVNSTGAWMLTKYQAGSFDQDLLPFPDWAGAARVAVGDTDGDGLADLVGLSADGDLLLLEDARGSNPAQTVLPMNGAVHDAAPLDWTGTGQDSVAVLSNVGFFVVARDGSVLYSYTAAFAEGFLMPFREAGQAGERCALFYTAGGMQFVVAVDSSGPEAPLWLGTAAVIGADVADVDGDGNEDLYFLDKRFHQTVVLFDRRAQGPTFALGPGTSELVPVGSGPVPPSWSAWPMLHDFNLDGDPDILTFVESSGALVFLENTRESAEQAEVLVRDGNYLFDQTARQGDLQLELEVPATLPFAPTHVQVVTWIQLDAALGGLEAAPSAVSNLLFPLDAAGQTTTHVALAEHGVFTPNIYHLDLRAVRIDPVHGLVESGPPVVHAFTTPEFLSAQLVAEFGGGIDVSVELIGTPSGGKSHVRSALGPPYSSERVLAPKDVRILHIPPIPFPPDPFP